VFCPNCHAEYAPGFTRCSDCAVELVEELPTAAARHVDARRRAPAPPDVSAYEGPGGSPAWLARHALVVFLVLPLLAYAVLALAHVRFVGVASVATGLSALIVCWSLGERQERPARLALRLLVFVLVTLGYAFALAIVEPIPSGLTPLRAYLPLAFVAGLLAQALLSPNAGLRRLTQPLLRWRAPWYVYALALLAWPLLAVLVVWLSRHLPGATAGTADGGFIGSTLRLGWLEALWAAPWALAWFGYGVPVLLRRRSALVAALTLGLLTWLQLGIALLIRGHADWTETYLNLGTGLALAVVAVWLFQRARGSVWPVLILQGTAAVSMLLNWAGDGFGVDYGAWTALVAAEVALAITLVVIGRMWQRPESAPLTTEPFEQPTEGDTGGLVEEHC
jgi:hypothetical protein